MLVPMAKVELIGPKSRFVEVVSLLHEQGKLHIEDLTKRIQSGQVPLDRMEIQGDEVRVYDLLDEQIIRVRSILKTLSEPEGGIDPGKRTIEYNRLWQLEPGELGEQIADVIGEVEAKTADLAALHTAAETELALLSRYEPVLGKIQPLAKQIVVTGAFDSVALLVERRYKVGLEHLEAELDKLTNSQCEIISTDIDENTTAAIVVFARQYAEPVHKFLSMENVNQIRLPQDFQDMPLDMAYDSIRQRRAALPAELDKIRKELADLSDRWYVKLSTARDVLVDRIDEIIAIPKFGRTEYAFMIDGWIPVSDLAELKAELKKHFGADVIVEQIEISEQDFEEAPVALSNPKWAEPYQGLLAFMGSPKYGTYDPTWMLAIFYPLFLGMIVGDIGYGLIMLGVVIWLRMKFKDNAGVQMATSILGPAATSVVLFGFFYGEFFGNILGPQFLNVIVPIKTAAGEQILPFRREHGQLINYYMYSVLFIGLAQVLLGLALGVYNGIRTKHKSHVYEKGGIFTFIIGFIILMGGSILLKQSLIVQAVGGFLLVVGLIYAIRGGKVLGLIESVLALSHIASYLRIMAVGLAGAIFANAVNGIAAKMGNPVLGILVAAPLQALNFVIAAFSPNIHAVRLNFLEFFGNFYETGSKEYSPFHKTGGEKRA
jgi:V/A-type H+-transporting ATPase subunit I